MELEFYCKIRLDGDQFCALIGDDLQEGISGFGATPKEALEALLEQLDENLNL